MRDSGETVLSPSEAAVLRTREKKEKLGRNLADKVLTRLKSGKTVTEVDSRRLFGLVQNPYYDVEVAVSAGKALADNGVEVTVHNIETGDDSEHIRQANVITVTAEQGNPVASPQIETCYDFPRQIYPPETA